MLRAADRAQQRFGPIAFVVAVQKKFGDDNAGMLVANLAYAGFVSIFPMLLIAVTVLGIIAGHNSGFAHSIETSVLAQFPIIGTELQSNVKALHSASTFSLIVGLLGLFWGVTGLSQTGLYAMAQVWNVPGSVRPNFVHRLTRSIAFLAVLAVGGFATGFLSSYGFVAHHGVALGIAVEAGSVAANVVLYLVGFRILTPRQVPTHLLWLGAALGGVAWTALQAAGGYLVAHSLRHETAVYGLFGIVLGLLAWIYLGARISIYAAEINVVRAYRLWPRAMVQPPLTAADRRSLVLIASQYEMRPEQRVAVSFPSEPDATPSGAATERWRDAGLDRGSSSDA
jgi:uncharacterized BrkB/YihY/UPF0761 family membrane protein